MERDNAYRRPWPPEAVTTACYACHGASWWSSGGPWVCSCCHPAYATVLATCVDGVVTLVKHGGSAWTR